MQTLTFEGQTVPFLELSDFTMGEVIWAEKQIGASFSDWTNGQEAVVRVCLSLRRCQIMLTIDDVIGLPLGTIIDNVDVVAEAEPEDPQAPGGEAGDSSSSDTSTSSD